VVYLDYRSGQKFDLVLLPERLPNSIGELRTLTVLVVSHQELTELPHSLGELNQLEELDISGNQFSIVPKILGSLTKLRQLTIDEEKHGDPAIIRLQMRGVKIQLPRD
jgi:Leucine-rich repeat (LRR) protein